jgi:hypothetical protein
MSGRPIEAIPYPGAARPHEFFNNIILLPDFGQARAKLE